MKVLSIVIKSPQYRVEDKYVLYDRPHNLIVSGDEEYILDRLYMKKESYINTLLSYLNNGTIFYSYWMRPIIGEC